MPRSLEILVDGFMRLVARPTDDTEDFVLLDELSDDLHGVRRGVVVIADDEVDLATVHTALRIYVVEKGLHAVGNRRVGGGEGPA